MSPMALQPTGRTTRLGCVGKAVCTRATEDADEREPLSAKARPAKARAVASVVFLVFLLAGLGLLYGIFLRPVGKILAARSWRKTPCVVVASRVRSHRGDDRPTYSVDILYAYEVGGREYRSGRYGFFGGSSSGHSGKAAIIKQHPPGKKAVCYVDPADPTEAVLERGATWHLLGGLIPLVFVLVGAGGLLYIRRHAPTRGEPTPQAEWLPTAADAASGLPGPVTLGAASSPLKKLAVAVVFAAFWNGIVSVFVWQVVQSWRRGEPEWFLTIFMTPFVLVGLGAIGAVGYCFLQLFSPRPLLTVSSQAVPLGGTLDVQWTMLGRIDTVRRMTLHLEGREEATYTRGTDTVTDKEVFARIEVADLADRYEILSGQAQVTVPPDTMHSFEAEHNKIVWALHLHADIPKWPDVDEEFPLAVLPASRAEEA